MASKTLSAPNNVNISNNTFLYSQRSTPSSTELWPWSTEWPWGRMGCPMRRWDTPSEVLLTGDTLLIKWLFDTRFYWNLLFRKLPPVPGNNASQSNYNTIDRIKKGTFLLFMLKIFLRTNLMVHVILLNVTLCFMHKTSSS